MKQISLAAPLGLAFAAALAATASAEPANRNLVVAITDESNVDAQQSTARLTRTADGRVTGDDRSLECYKLARSIVDAARRAQLRPTSLPIDVGLMATVVPLTVFIAPTSEATLAIRAASRGILSDGQSAVPAGVTIEGAIGFDGSEPTSALIRETVYAGNTSLPSHATTCRLGPAPQQA